MAQILKPRSHHRALTKRQKEIVDILTRFEGKSIAVKTIAERLEVSNRTILRDISRIEEWMNENDFSFDHKPGVGLQINEDQDNMELIRELLEIDERPFDYSRNERRQYILGTLFNQSEPIKTYALTTHLGISQNTLFADLDSLDLWLADYNVVIIRKKGVGIYIEGDEYNLRQAIMNYIFKFCDFDQVPVGMLNDETAFKAVAQNPLLSFLKPDIYEFAYSLVDYAEQQMRVNFTDGGRIRLAFRYDLAINRMQQGAFITQLPKAQNRLSSMMEQSVSIQMMAMIEEKFHIKIPQSEVYAMAMFLASSRVWTDTSQFKDPSQSMELWQVVNSMIRVVEQMTGLKFDNNKFSDDLINHIRIVEKRISLDIVEENRQTRELKENYPDLFKAVDTACQVLREWISPKELREADVGYIALHFAAEAIRIQQRTQKIGVAIVCPLGVGSSKILAASLQKAFSNVDVIRIMSAFNIDVDQLKNDGIDMIVTTTPLDIDFPVVQVKNIILKSDDCLLVGNEIERIVNESVNALTREKAKETVSYNYEDVIRLTQLGLEIKGIVDHLTLDTVDNIRSKNDLIKQAAQLFAHNTDDYQIIYHGMSDREVLLDTYIKDMGIYLFHCITNVVSQARFGYIGVTNEFVNDKGKVDGAVVMIVPENNMFALESIGRISSMLVEEGDFLKSLKAQDMDKSQAYVKEALVKYFSSEMT
ncbi:MAG: PRD domain-containing protein [Erysipelotrichaceae bacterium]|nr:PRD domain-containing protein [Erysipelotrichaceae bacterium]